MVISILSIAATLFINYLIAQEYARSGGKTSALFGLKELYQFGYQYYVVALGGISMSLVWVTVKRRHPCNFTAFLLSIIAITIVFLRIWRIL